MAVVVTRIGGPTVLIEVQGWRIIVDPTFDDSGRRYDFGLGTSSIKTAGPAIPVSEIGRIDLALVSHDHHADNLDDAGRGLLSRVEHVVTTVPGARRLGEDRVKGLRSGQSVVLELPGRPSLEVTATPARHGPALSRSLVGHVIGSLVRVGGDNVWVTGDTVWYRSLRRFARKLTVDVAIVNAGGVQFPQTGPIRYTMRGPDAVRLIAATAARVAIPAHYEGWSHFRDGEEGFVRAVADAPAAVRDSVRFLPLGVPTEV